MDNEKLDWLKEIGAIEFTPPMKWFVELGDNAYAPYMHYSEEYIEKTPLEKLKDGYQKSFPLSKN